MNALKVIAVCALLAFSASAMAQDDQPAAEGYIKGKASNESQDKQLKEIEAEEKGNYAPDPEPTPTPEPEHDSGNDAATDPNSPKPGMVD